MEVPECSEVNSCQGEINQKQAGGLNYLLDLFSLSSISFFLLRGAEEKAKQQKNENALDMGNRRAK